MEPVPTIDFYGEQRVVENDLVVRGNGVTLTTTGDNVISINGNGTAATLTYNYPDWITDISAE